MKSLIIGLLALTSISVFAQDLPSNAAPLYEYKQVAIHSVDTAKLNVKRIPQTRTSVAYYKGTLDLNLTVEGNLCLGDENTFGIMQDRFSSPRTLSLIVGTKLPKPENTFCLQYSNPTTTKVSLDINISIFKDEGPITIDYAIPVGYNNESVSIHVYEEKNQLKLKL